MTSSAQTDARPPEIDRAQPSADEAVVRTRDQMKPGAIDQDRRPQEQAFSDRSAGIVAAVAKLGATLHGAATSNAEQPQDVRKVAANILVKVIDLILELYPDHPDWVIPLNQLLFGLKDLDRGKPNSLFEAVKLENRPPNNVADVLFRAIPAAAMTVLMKKRQSQTHRSGRDNCPKIEEAGL
jgi:hypothetical protein